MLHRGHFCNLRPASEGCAEALHSCRRSKDMPQSWEAVCGLSAQHKTKPTRWHFGKELSFGKAKHSPLSAPQAKMVEAVPQPTTRNISVLYFLCCDAHITNSSADWLPVLVQPQESAPGEAALVLPTPEWLLESQAPTLMRRSSISTLFILK